MRKTFFSKLLWCLSIAIIAIITGCGNSNKEASTSIYSDYFLPVTNEETDYEIEKVKGSLACSTQMPSEENAYCFIIDQLTDDDGKVYSDIRINLREYHHEGEHWVQNGVFSATGFLYISLVRLEDSTTFIEEYSPCMLMIRIPTENTADYNVIAYHSEEIASLALWFTEPKQLNNTLYYNLLLSGKHAPVAINLESGQIQILTEINTQFHKVAEEFLNNNEQTVIVRQNDSYENLMISYDILYQMDDVTIISGTVFDSSINEDEVIKIIGAMSDNRMIDYIVINPSNGSVVDKQQTK